jgi:HrpA-like RNA helicase
MELAKFSEEIEKQILKNKISIFIAGTGSGKSLFIPFCIFSSKRKSKIFITCNTIPSAIALYNMQKKMLQNVLKINTDEGIDQYIGYAADSVKHYNDETNIVYCTARHILNRIVDTFSDPEKKKFDFCDYLFVDEAHTKTLDISVILTLWDKSFKESEKDVPSLIIATATEDKFLKDINPIYCVFKTKPYEVIKNFLEQTPTRKQLWDDIAVKATEINEFDKKLGDILIFVPGRGEMERVISKFELLNKDKDNYKIYRIIRGSHDQESLDEEIDKRKIIFGTNIVETSITIPNLFCVIDSMKEKIISSSAGAVKFLETQTISKDSSIQRAGRVGRTKPGIYIAMMSESDYEKLNEHRSAEIERLDLYEIILKLFSSGLNPIEILADAPEKTVISSIKLLENLSFIKDKDENYILTKKGRVCVNFPLKIRNSSFLYQWADKYPNFIFIGIVVACTIDSLSGPSFFSFDETENTDVQIQTTLSQFVKKSDIGTFLKIILECIIYMEGDLRNRVKLMEFCKQNLLNHNKVKEILTKISLCTKDLKRNEYKFEPEIPEVDNFINEYCDDIEKVLYNSYFNRELFYINGKYYLFPRISPDEKITEAMIKKDGRQTSVSFLMNFRGKQLELKLNKYDTENLVSLEIFSGISRYNFRNFSDIELKGHDLRKSENVIKLVEEGIQVDNDDENIIYFE